MSSRSLLVLLAATFVTACSTPTPPTLTVKDSKITSMDIAGAVVTADLDAYNPNSFDIVVKSFEGRMVVDGNKDMGAVSLQKPITLTANAHTTVAAPLALKWQDLSPLTSLALSPRAVPYVVSGTAHAGTSSVAIDVPFRAEGSITREQVTSTVAGSLPAMPFALPKAL